MNLVSRFSLATSILLAFEPALSSTLPNRESKYIDIKHGALTLRYLNGLEGFCGDLKNFPVAIKWQEANPRGVMDNDLLSSILRINGALERVGQRGVEEFSKLC